MKTKTISILIMGLLYINISLAQTHHDKYIHVADTIVNLADVDLEKGLILTKALLQQMKTDEYIQYEVKVFKNFNNQYYMIVKDSSFLSGYGGVYKSSFTYYKADGLKLFTKHFNRLNINRVFILKNGNKVVVDLGSEESIKFILYDDKGNVLKEIDNKEVYILSDNEYKTIYIQPDGHNNELQIINFDRKDIDILKFSDRVWLRNFSPDGEFFTIRYSDSLMVFDRYGDFKWGLKYDKQNIYVFSNGLKYYVEYPFPIGKIEVKKSINHILLYKIDGVYFKGIKYPIYKSGVINNTDIIWVSNYVNKHQIFNFIDEKGQIINEYSVPAKIATHDISFKKTDKKYIVIY